VGEEVAIGAVWVVDGACIGAINMARSAVKKKPYIFKNTFPRKRLDEFRPSYHRW
jgi:hypothetical protein